MSIKNQRDILARFAAERGFGNTEFYVDDGISGTDFKNREALNRLRGDIYAGKIGVLICKDMSRLGRDVLEVGLIKRDCEDYSVRLIAPSDNYDSINGYDIVSTMRDAINEMYAADTSRKIRDVKRNSALQGKALGKLPYGYYVEKDRSVWLIDEPAADIIREIFEKFVEGVSASVICRDLTARGVVPPKKHSGDKSGSDVWSIASIYQMLIDPVYIGKYVSHKMTTVSYKNKKRIERPEEEWVVIDNHHDSIIDTKIFEAVQRMRSKRKRYTKRGDRSVLSGLAHCNDCGATMAYAMQGQNYDYPNFICKTYRQADCLNRHKCTRHGIRVNDLEEYVFRHVKEYIDLANTNQKELERRVYNSTSANAEKRIKSKTAELSKTEREIEQVDSEIDTLFRDRTAGRLSEERFYNMLPRFESKQVKLKATAETLRVEIENLTRKTADVSGFVELAKEYKGITEFTEKVARLFVENVMVHEAVFATGTKRKKVSQEISITLALIGEL
jgi:DNA invertase Pin-like site-specific DNA recombinase